MASVIAPEKLLTRMVDEMRTLTDRYTSGQIDGGSWQYEMRQMLRKDYALQIINEAGGIPSQVNPNDWLRMGSQLQSQYRYLEQFARDVESGKLSPAQAASRAGLYAKSSGQMAAMQKAPVGLPTYPKAGDSVCLGNCLCEWDIQEVLDSDGGIIGYDCTWRLHADESCPDCKRFARQWNPLRLPV